VPYGPTSRHFPSISRPSKSRTLEAIGYRYSQSYKKSIGYREGENLLAWAFDGREEANHLVENLKKRINEGVNVVVASGPEITLRLAIAATRTLPIVMVAFDYDPWVQQDFGPTRRKRYRPSKRRGPTPRLCRLGPLHSRGANSLDRLSLFTVTRSIGRSRNGLSSITSR
jgi:hypothetical protein